MTGVDISGLVVLVHVAYFEGNLVKVSDAVDRLIESRAGHLSESYTNYISRIDTQVLYYIIYMKVAFFNLRQLPHAITYNIHYAHNFISTYPSPERLPSPDLKIRIAYPSCLTIDIRQIKTNFSQNGKVQSYKYNQGK